MSELPDIAAEPPKPTPAATLLRMAKRGIWSARLAHIGLFCLAIAGFILSNTGESPIGMGLLFATAMAWVLLVGRTARDQADLMRVPAWLGDGRFALAEGAATRALSRFSIAGRPRVQSLHALAVARFGLGRGEDARQLADAALQYRQPKAAADTLRLLIAETALAVNDLYAAHAALTGLVAPLPLRESLKVLELQTDYCVRIGAWPHAGHDLPAKIEMAELLPTEAAATVQAMLALATRRLGQPQWSAWLTNRVTLLTDTKKLVDRCPVLAELFPVPSPGTPGEG